MIASSKERKPRLQGVLSQLKHKPREQLHRWFRENLTYKEIAKKLKNRLEISVGPSALCGYYHRRSWEIFGIAADREQQGKNPAQTIVIRIEIRLGSVPTVSTEVGDTVERAKQHS